MRRTRRGSAPARSTVALVEHHDEHPPRRRHRADAGRVSRQPGPRAAGSPSPSACCCSLVGALAWRTLALARQRDEFTSCVSHELRTPLANIQLLRGAAARSRPPVDERRGALETITRETRRLVHMMENLLASPPGRPAVSNSSHRPVIIWCATWCRRSIRCSLHA